MLTALKTAEGVDIATKYKWTHTNSVHILLIVNFSHILCFDLPNTPFYSGK